MTEVNPNSGSLMGGPDAGGCRATRTGCTLSATCDEALGGDAGSLRISETATINGDGSLTASVTVAYMYSYGGTTESATCTYSGTGTKE
jgi:hypothetical protein